MESIWNQDIQIPQREPLPDHVETDTAVIGGGLAGITIAYALQQRGIPTIVLEAGRIASGQTGNTTAKITSQHDLIYSKLIRNFGMERARQYAQANQSAIHAYRTLIQQRHISCDFETIPAYLYTCTHPDLLQREAAAAQQLGIDAHFTRETALPFSIKGAVRFENQAQFHPLKFLSNIAKEVTVYEQTSVRTIDDNMIDTNHGNVKAKHIVFATQYPFVNFPGLYFARMHQERSYVLALRGAQQLDGAYLGIDNDGCSFRNAGELLLLGGGSHRTGMNQAGGQYQALRMNAQTWYPNSTEVTRWSAQDCIPIDGVPYIGPFARSKPNWYIATGFQKWGMTSAMVAATLLSDLICGQHNAYAEVFSPQRFYLRASAKKLSANVGQFAKSLTKRALCAPKLTLEALPKGHGGVVSADGKKVGAYRDETGAVHLVSVKCPHLGCQLAWNPEERSWDCPCHGSRFDYTGKRISGPAQTDISLTEFDNHTIL